MIEDQDHLVNQPLRPDDFEHRMLIRNRGELFPENGRKRTLSIPTPVYGGGVLYAEPAIVRDRGAVFAFDVLLDNPLGSLGVDVSALRVGAGHTTFFEIYFDTTDEIRLLVNRLVPNAQASLTVPFAKCRLSNTRPVRIAAGIRLHDPNRFLCLWADGRLIAVTGKGSFPSQPTSWAANTQLEIENNGGIRIVSPQVAYYRGAPEPRGANR